MNKTGKTTTHVYNTFGRNLPQIKKLLHAKFIYLFIKILRYNKH